VQFKTTRTFTRAFKRLKKKYRDLDKDIERLRSALIENPTAGISLGTGFYKIRLASSDMAKGKRGAFRVIYYLMPNPDKPEPKETK
jgi:mRNA-degrading endonuclease RelE of RelBE toxin-antitoxin system